MIHRFQVVFWPSKGRAAIAAIGCLVLAILFFSSPDFIVFGAGCLTYSLWYGLVWLIKFSRDKQLAEQARASLRPPVQPQVATPPQRSPESNQLFVPPPHPGQR